jgi:U3 small nucleolar ribonucleoprotein protein LCP5
MPSDDAEDDKSDDGQRSDDGIYHPPKLAPVPYNEESAKSKKTRAAPVAKTLSSLAHLDPSMPYSESVSGLGGGSVTKSSVARTRLDEMTRYEEENMTRMLLNKKETKRRKRDEADIALGGMGGGRARGGGLEEEFDDVLKSVGRARASGTGDGYEELRHRSRKADALSRSRTRKEPEDTVDGGRDRKRSKFEKDVLKMKRKGSRR